MKRRLVCAVCGRPQTACICRWITPVANVTEVLILQHPLEVDHAKNSAHLLNLSLRNSRLLTGEAFDETSLQSALQSSKYTVLLYPLSAHEPTLLADQVLLQDPLQLRLVVLDATWRKSRKMLHQSPVLRHLPRLSLNTVPASLYTIRKAHHPGQLSTLEATCSALTQLEGDTEKFQPLLRGFQGFVAQQLAYRRLRGTDLKIHIDPEATQSR